MPSRPSKATATKLWTLSGNECANPDCINKVFEIDDHSGEMTKLGQIAHINAANLGGSRYVPGQTDEERHSFKNLMVLCSSCHTEQPDGIDIPVNEDRFPAVLLQEWRELHLNKIKSQQDKNWICRPNQALLSQDGYSIDVKYWINSKGLSQLYSSEQLAIVEHLGKMLLSFSQIHGMLKIIEDSEGKPVDPSHQTINDSRIHQLYQELKRLPHNAFGWFGFVFEAMQVAHEIKLEDVMVMDIENGLRDKEKDLKDARELLRKKAKVTESSPKIRLHRK